ncbi:hypothetical protein [Aeoliella straminimaris]|nr:hypothetical protein [Aeoliella straminimaris]
MGRIADPENTPVVDRGPGGVSDVFRVGCAETEDIALCEGTPLMGDQAILWIASVSLIGDSALISSENETLNLSTLNAFSFREMSLTFFDPSTGNAVKVGAFVGDVRVVPEPASTQLITALLPMLILCTSLHACPWRPHFRHKNATGE